MPTKVQRVTRRLLKRFSRNHFPYVLGHELHPTLSEVYWIGEWKKVHSNFYGFNAIFPNEKCNNDYLHLLRVNEKNNVHLNWWWCNIWVNTYCILMVSITLMVWCRWKVKEDNSEMKAFKRYHKLLNGPLNPFIKLCELESRVTPLVLDGCVVHKTKENGH